MTWLPALVTAEPASEPVTLAEAKAQCRVDSSDDDAWLSSRISAARILVEQSTGTKLVSQTVELRCSRWCDLTDLPTAPLSAVTGITYIDTEGATQALGTSVYESVLIGFEPLIRLKVNQSWPSIRCVADAITVTATAGYTTVPEPIRAAMMMLIAQWYDERSSISGIRQTPTADGSIPTLPNTVDALLANYRRF